MVPVSLRDYIDLIEGKKPIDDSPWGVAFGPTMRENAIEYKRSYPDIGERISRFIAAKAPDPIRNRFSANDAPMASNSAFAGLLHAHLAPDLIILYSTKNRILTLVALCQHQDIEGKRAKSFAKRIGL